MKRNHHKFSKMYYRNFVNYNYDKFDNVQSKKSKERLLDVSIANEKEFIKDSNLKINYKGTHIKNLTTEMDMFNYIDHSGLPISNEVEDYFGDIENLAADSLKKIIKAEIKSEEISLDDFTEKDFYNIYKLMVNFAGRDSNRKALHKKNIKDGNHPEIHSTASDQEIQENYLSIIGNPEIIEAMTDFLSQTHVFILFYTREKSLVTSDIPIYAYSEGQNGDSFDPNVENITGLPISPDKYILMVHKNRILFNDEEQAGEMNNCPTIMPWFIDSPEKIKALNYMTSAESTQLFLTPGYEKLLENILPLKAYLDHAEYSEIYLPLLIDMSS